MSWDKNEMISRQEIQEKVTDVTVQFAEKFGNYLAEKEDQAEPLTYAEAKTCLRCWPC